MMRPVMGSTIFTLLLALGLPGCAELPEAHLHGEVIYLGELDRQAVDVPPEASPLVKPCLGDSLVQQAGELFGIGKTDEKITPPFFVGLWPVAGTEEDERHGRHDEISVGVPQPGDNPFLKQVVCTADEFDWNIGEVLEGEYYIGVWLDLDFNGFPGEDEPMGFYRGDDGSETFDPSQTDPVTVTFDGTPRKVRLQIGVAPGGLGEQFNDIRLRLERALHEEDDQLFLNQFHPLYYKDAHNRTFNQLQELWLQLGEDNHPDLNEVSWFGEQAPSSGTRSHPIVVDQVKQREEGSWDLAGDVEHRVELVLGDWRDDDIYQIIDWKPLWILSGEFGEPSAAPSAFDGDSSLTFTLNFPAPMTMWTALEQFVPEVTGETRGYWQPVTATGNPRTCSFIPGDSGNIVLTSTSSSAPCRMQSVEFDAGAMLRLTVVPMTDEEGDERYPQWAGYPAAITEPERGNFARFYLYGSDYHYRRQLSAERNE